MESGTETASFRSISSTSSRISSAVSVMEALESMDWRVRRRRVFFRRGSAPERGRTVRILAMRESGTVLRRRNSATHRETSGSILFGLREKKISRTNSFGKIGDLGKNGKNSGFFLCFSFSFFLFG